MTGSKSLKTPTLFVMTLLLSAACDSPWSEVVDRAASRTDSSGIILWDYPQKVQAVGVSLSSRPILVLDDPEPGSGRPFDDVSKASLLQGRGILIVDAREPQHLTLFDNAGKLRWAAELRSLGVRSVAWLQYWRDSLVVGDNRGRVVMLDRRGVLARSIVIESDSSKGYPPHVAGVGIVEQGTALAEFYSNPAMAHGASRPVRELRLVSPEGGPGSMLTTYAGPEIQLIADGNGFFVTTPMFGRTTHVVIDGAGFATVDTERYLIERFSPDGTLVQVIRRRVDRSISPSLVNTVIRDRLRATPRRLRRRGEDNLRAQLYHIRTPAVGRIVSADGVLWVSQWRASVSEEEEWTAYGLEGEVLGALAIPAGYEVLDFTLTTALLLRGNGREAPSLAVYGLWWGV